MSAGDKDNGIICVGRVYLDLVFAGLEEMPRPGRESFAKSLCLSTGGGAAITAAYLASLERRAQLVAMLPAAPFGQMAEEELRTLGVDMTGTAIGSDAKAPQLTVVMPIGDDRAFLTKRSGAACDLDALEAAAKSAEHIHIGEISTLIDMPEIVEIANGNSCSLSCDCSWDGDLQVDAIATLLPSLDIFLPNKDEYDWLRSVGIRPGAAQTVIKCGADGAEAQGCKVPTLPQKAVDTTGAGDAFNAGFLDAWLSGQDVASCLAAGNTLGGRAVGAYGGLGALRAG